MDDQEFRVQLLAYTDTFLLCIVQTGLAANQHDINGYERGGIKFTSHPSTGGLRREHVELYLTPSCLHGMVLMST